MKENQNRVLCKDKGKYLEISFISGLMSAVLIAIYLFISQIFSIPESIQQEIYFNTTVTVMFHSGIAMLMGFILGFKEKVTYNSFPVLAIGIGTLVEGFFPVQANKIGFILISLLSWFLFSALYLGLEKKYASELNDTYKKNDN